jgi:hypothetical protein
MTGKPTINRLAGIGRLAAILGCALAVAFVGAVRAQEVDINPNDAVGPVPAFGGTGLFGQYYNFQTVTSQIPNTATADSLVAGSNGPIATFLSGNICFPECDFNSTVSDDSATLIDFLNGHATNIHIISPLPPTYNQSVIDLTGYIAITQPGYYDFLLDSDDGSELFIDSQFVAGSGVIQSLGSGFSEGEAYFSATGIYAFALKFFENGGGSGLELYGYDPSGNCLFGCTSDGDPSPLLYNDGDFAPAPAPTVGAGWAGIAALAAFALAEVFRRRGFLRR